MAVMRNCPICSVSIKIKESDIGRVISCPWCENALIVRIGASDVCTIDKEVNLKHST